MKFPIITDLIAGLPKVNWAKGLGAYEGIIAHSTDTPEATAANEVAFEKRDEPTSGIFVHFFVDWNEIKQTASLAFRGQGAGRFANPHYVHAELCETKDKAKFEASYAKWTWLLAWVLFQRKLGVVPKQTFWTHDMITSVLGGTTHHDPVAYLASHGVSIDKLIADVQAEYHELEHPEVFEIVDAGETIWGYAQKYNTTEAAIIALNPGVDPKALHIGQKIRVK